MTFPRHFLLVVGIIPALVFSLTACAPTVGVPAAPEATLPVCANIVLATPKKVVDLSRIRTTSQATTAWGTGGAAVTFRCGVPQPAASPDCVSIAGSRGITVDWIAKYSGSDWTFVSYGRQPAVEVRVPDSAGIQQPTAVLADVSSSISSIEATKECT